MATVGDSFLLLLVQAFHDHLIKVLCTNLYLTTSSLTALQNIGIRIYVTADDLSALASAWQPV